MDTQDKFVPRGRASRDTLTRDTAVDGDAGVNPEAISANPGLDNGIDERVAREADANPDADFNPDPDALAPVTGPEPAVKGGLKRWQIAGLIAGGVALAAGVAGAVYLRQASSPKAQVKAQAKKLQAKAQKAAKIDLSQAHPRRLSQMAARQIERLPVQKVQKRVAHRVAHMFD